MTKSEEELIYKILNPCSNPEIHSFGSKPCCQGIILDMREQIIHLKAYAVAAAIGARRDAIEEALSHEAPIRVTKTKRYQAVDSSYLREMLATLNNTQSEKGKS